jgi:uncharacterized surface protein with fasciclin (FAS1) repeats
MAQYQTAEEVRRFDRAKLIVLIILILLLLLTWFLTRGRSQQSIAEAPAEAPTEVAAATAVPEAVASTDEAGEAPAVDIALPALDAPDGPLSPGVVVLTGRGEPGSEVAVLVDGEQVETAIVGDDGVWSLPLELSAGDHEVIVQTLSESGDVLNESESLVMAVVEQSPPTIDVPEERFEPGMVTLTGTAAPGAELEIIVNDEVVGTTTAADDGTWSLDVELAEGENTVQAQTLDQAGAVGLSSEVARLAVGRAETGGAAGDTILEAAGEAGRFVTFLELVDAAGLRETLDGEGPFTILAPTDDAFAALPQNVQDALSGMPLALLRTVLEAHVVEGTLTAEDIANASTLETLSGDDLAIRGAGAAAIVEGATLRAPAIRSGNGIIHAIDRVLLPSPLAPADIQAPVIDDSGVPTFECCRLTVVGDAQPGTELLLLANGEQFGEIVPVDEDGFWLVTSGVEIGDYDLVALMFGEDGRLLGVSPRVFLAVTG